METFRTLTLDLHELAPFEVGAKLMAVLNYPGRAEEEKAERVTSSLCAQFLRNAQEEYPEDPQYASAKWPEYKVRYNRALTAGLRGGSKKIMDVGAITLTFLKEPMENAPPILPTGVRANVSSQLRFLTGKTEKELSDERSRVFTRWLPVAHLAAAYVLALKRIGNDELGVGLDDLDLHRSVVRQAHKFTLVMAERDLLGWARSDPLLIHWIEPAQISAAGVL